MDRFFERYELSQHLGTGSVTEAYRGHDTQLERDVVVKALRSDLASDPDKREWFRQQARIAATLDHPAIVPVRETGERDTPEGPRPYLVTDDIDGKTVREVIAANGPVAQGQALKIIADVCVALDHAHRHGVVHGAVDDRSVILGRGGTVMVTDFGLTDTVPGDHTRTRSTGEASGPTAYTSPEQLQGRPADERSDVHAAGALLFQLLTGTDPSVLAPPNGPAEGHVQRDRRRPSSVDTAVPHTLDAVILTALAEHPDRRYQSALALRADLVRALSGHGPAATAGSSAAAEAGEDEPERRSRLVPVLAAVAIAAVAFAMWLAGLFDSGEHHAEVPVVVGQQYSSAERSLRDAGFHDLDRQAVPCWPETYGAEPPCDGDSVGRVIGTDPEHGTSHPLNTRIVVHVGAPPEVFVMPDLTGMTVEEAEQEIEDSDLLLDPAEEKVDNTDPDRTGKVAEHTPEPDSVTEQGQVVTLSIYDEPEMVEVTDYVGESYRVARTGLEDAGFEVVREDVDSDEPEDTVVGQSPRRGEAVEGSEVTLRVSRGGNERFDMPDVVGLTEGTARSTLDDAGHTGTVKTRRRAVGDEAEHGKVTSSIPSADRSVRADRTVTLYIGRYERGLDTDAPETGDASEDTDDPGDGDHHTTSPPAESSEPPPGSAPGDPDAR
ncbi:serine/threonine protein kinase [Haloechinothrix alba]|uniref:non-specific serine/threonine protein kinase n=1 Tax=Haloechinothrix alba TaxID=664784 RepID=A0A238YLK5_9PSEU|nr:Stk1 family PASTA domain-containing Ser/Thr kinase [Haloechinothrix alba]SNR72017.1 serine/threonine protein kinase [Haloechinothrix alba]